MSKSVFPSKLVVGITVLVVAIVLLSGSAVWATGEQSPLAQTVPTPTPTLAPWPWPGVWVPAWYPWCGSPGWGPPGWGPPGYFPPPQSYVVSYTWGYSSWSPYYTPWAQPYPYQQNWNPYPWGPVW